MSANKADKELISLKESCSIISCYATETAFQHYCASGNDSHVISNFLDDGIWFYATLGTRIIQRYTCFRDRICTNCLGIDSTDLHHINFFSKGKGTIAPWNPTMNLIKTGIYGHTRNPMMIAVFFVLMGESSIIGSVYLVFYSVIFVIVNLFYIPLVEEPKLIKRFGEEYLKYQKEVPRWLPTKCQRNKQK